VQHLACAHNEDGVQVGALGALALIVRDVALVQERGELIEAHKEGN
jgi:hypothetical protein